MQKTTIITNKKEDLKTLFTNIWVHKELLYFLAQRDIRVRYHHRSLGMIWIVIQAVIMISIFTFSIGRNNFFRGNLPYPIFVAAGLIFWLYFNNTLQRAGTSFIQNRMLISKVSFPLLILPLSSLLVGWIDIGILFILFVFLTIIYHLHIYFLGFLLFLLSFLIVLLTCAGLGITFACLHARYKDTREIQPFIMTIFFFLSPIIVPLHNASFSLALLFYLNPLTACIEITRQSFFGQPLFLPGILVSILSSFCIFSFGIWYYLQTEQTLADIL